MAVSPESLSTEEKILLPILGIYEDKDKTGLGMLAGVLEHEAGFKVGQPRDVLRGLWQKKYIALYDKDGQKYEGQRWILDFNAGPAALSEFLTTWRCKLTDKGLELCGQLPKATPESAQTKRSPLDQLKHPVSCVDVAAIVGKMSHNIAAKLRRRDYPVVLAGGRNYCEVEHAIILYPLKRAALEKYKNGTE